MVNLMLPGNPRYQPPELIPYFGYDNLVRWMVRVEIATMETLAEMGVIPKATMSLLTTEVLAKLLTITTTEVDKREREVTKHDIRALVQLIQERIPEPLRKWVHIPLTSYDVIDTARALQYTQAHELMIKPLARSVIKEVATIATTYIKTPQIGRTHGQHALPITVGFWLATILQRMAWNAKEMDRFAESISGKISGAVGAYNAQHAIGLCIETDRYQFERCVLEKLGVAQSPISTQVAPPEPLSYYLFSCIAMSGSLGQFGRDSRHLMRTEIGEIAEAFAKGQVGSSTMAHKRNPISFENTEGMWESQKADLVKIMSLMVSEHQRDLVGSSVARDLPAILVRLVQQLKTIKRVAPKLIVDKVSCSKNLSLQGDIILAEPLYIALQMAGYAGDAHELVNHTIVKRSQNEQKSMYDVVCELAEEDDSVAEAWKNVPDELLEVLQSPEQYVGYATQKARDMIEDVNMYLL